ncbi:MAG: phenylalanine--tRNA ligase subunit beta [Bacteroidales bacterium]|nr:phenylalanine--tRNA ligase subunit beta [Candidatus Colimorpha onthohippi]
MKISYKWLNEYVDTEHTPQELDDLLTFSGLEIEGVERVDTIKGGLEHVVVAQVLTCEPHPDSDHLHITTVDVGGERPLDIVCGAPNVAAGQKVVCAQIGTKIYTSDDEFYEIKRGKLRGAVSEGMLCAADELQLGTSHDGIMVLPDDAPVGMPAKEYFHVEEDYTLEVAITANRSDATSHIGVARDIVAVLNTRENAKKHIQWPATTELNQSTAPGITVSIEDPERCPRYSGILLEEVKVAESPEWLQNKLRTVGIRPINNVVDVTNFVLMEVGQPMHAFDADKIAGREIHVRCLPQDTPFVTLDGVERKLDSRDLMICDQNEGMCIAGVFGGEKSGVSMQTTSVFLESAYFNPVSIRKTSKRHGLHTDASFRYERGCDPNITLWALGRAVKLLQEIAGATVASRLVDIYPTPIERATVEIKYQRVFDLIGQALPIDAIRTALQGLDIEIEHEDAEGMTLRIPTCKVDVTRECDVIEEIMRIYGYNNISFDERLNSCLSYSKKPNPRMLQNTVSDYLSNNGFNEIMNNSLTKSEYYVNNADFEFNRCIQIINPLSKELNVMRQTLLYSGMECVSRNINYRIADQKLYEFGRTYEQDPTVEEGTTDVTKRFTETQHLSLFVTGAQSAENWKSKNEPVDFYNLKAFVTNILKRMRVNMTRTQIVSTACHYFAEGLDIVMRDSKKVLVSMGRLNKETLKMMDCKQDVYYADINWDLILKNYPSKEVIYTEIAKQPEVRRDLSLIVRQETTFAEIEQVALSTEKKLLKSVGLFDVYEGKGIEEGKKSYAISFILQDKEKTLTDKQIESVMSKIQTNLEKQLGATLRQ